jgi:toxin-antitoxin system PIN domain toxin
MSADYAALDTNVLVYALYADAEHHRPARILLDQAEHDDIGFCLTPQILTEFYAVVTNPRRVTEAKSPGEALDVIDTLLSLPGIILLSVPIDIVAQWTRLLRQYPVTGADVFDVLLAATLRSHGVSRLYTFNRADFERFDDLHVLTPAAP